MVVEVIEYIKKVRLEGTVRRKFWILSQPDRLRNQLVPSKEAMGRDDASHGILGDARPYSAKSDSALSRRKLSKRLRVALVETPDVVKEFGEVDGTVGELDKGAHADKERPRLITRDELKLPRVRVGMGVDEVEDVLADVVDEGGSAGGDVHVGLEELPVEPAAGEVKDLGVAQREVIALDVMAVPFLFEVKHVSSSPEWERTNNPHLR